jgi:hypothetical protein
VAERRVKTEVFVEPGRIIPDEKPLRYVELRDRGLRADEGFAKARGPLLVVVVAGLSTWAFVAMAAWAL